MKKRTIYTLPKDTEITGDIIAKVIADNKEYINIFTKLESYVDDAPEMERVAPTELLTINNFADYITSVNVGYLLGNPVDYKATNGTNIDVILDAFRSQTIYDLDADLEADCSMFGQAFENVYVDESTTTLSAKLSVFNTIVVYDNTFKHNKMFAVYYSPLVTSNGIQSDSDFDVTIWTPTATMYRKLKGKVLVEDVNQPDVVHFFGNVPVIHYLNNKRLKGDYEPVISLIDAYNILQSDRVLDREKLVDAILGFYGMTVTDEDLAAIKENRAIGMPENSKAEYIVKNLDESGADVLRKTIAADIHKFSKTPDLTDETFGNSPSGVSILYKLLAFEQNVKTKERHFELGLKERFGLYMTVMSKLSKINDTLLLKDLDVVFRRSLPKNDFETSQIINNLDGKVDDETLVGQLSFVNDASEVVKKAKAERDENMQLGNFGTTNFEKESV